MMRTPRSLSCVLVVALAVGATPAYAGGEDEAAATELFNAGRDAMKRGEFAAACPKLAESVRLQPTVGALAKLAECEEHEGRLVGAYAHWQQALNLARGLGDERTGDVERELARIDRRVPKLVITAGAPMPSDALIQLDRTTLSAASLGVRLPVEPGAHTVQASAAGKATWSTQVVTSADGATTSVVIPRLEDAPAAPAPPPAATPAAPRDTPVGPSSAAPSTAPTALAPPAAPSAAPSSSWHTVGLVAAGVGVTAVAVGAAFGLDALRRRDDANCPNNACPDAASAASLQSAKTSANWSTGLFAGGAALLAGGAALWWLTPSGHGATTPPPRVGVAPIAGGWTIAAAWTR